MINHGFYIDVNPIYRYRRNSITNVWTRILQYPILADDYDNFCNDTIEFNMTPEKRDDWVTVGQIKIRRHTTPFAFQDEFTNVIPRDIWDKMGELIGVKRRDYMAFHNTFLEEIDWNRYNKLENEAGVPFDRLNNSFDSDSFNRRTMPSFLEA